MPLKLAFATVGDQLFFPGLLATVNSIRRYHPQSDIYVVDNCKYATGMTEPQKRLLKDVAILDASSLDAPGRVLGAWQLKTYLLDRLVREGYDVVCGIDADCLLCSSIDDIARQATSSGKFMGGQDGGGVDYAESGYRAYNFAKPAFCRRYISTSFCVIPVNMRTLSVLAEAVACTNEAEYGPQLAKLYKGHGDQGILNAVIYKQLGEEGMEALPNDLWSQHWRYWDTILSCEDGVLLNHSAGRQRQRTIHCGGTDKFWNRAHSEKLRAGWTGQIAPYCWFLYNLFFGCETALSMDPFLYLPPESYHLLDDLLYFYSRLTDFGNAPAVLWDRIGRSFLARLRGDVTTFMSLESSLSTYIRLAKNLPPGAKLVEIGSYEGGSILTVAIACLNSDLTLYSVESFTGNYDGTMDGHRLPSMPAYYKNIHVDRPNMRLITINAASSVAARQFADATLDMVFIDDNHSEDGVRSSLRSWTRKVRPGGIIAGDDFHFASVRKVVTEALGPDVRDEHNVWWARKQDGSATGVQ